MGMVPRATIIVTPIQINRRAWEPDLGAQCSGQNNDSDHTPIPNQDHARGDRDIEKQNEGQIYKCPISTWPIRGGLARVPQSVAIDPEENPGSI